MSIIIEANLIRREWKGKGFPISQKTACRIARHGKKRIDTCTAHELVCNTVSKNTLNNTPCNGDDKMDFNNINLGELKVKTVPNPKGISIHCSTARAARCALKIALKYSVDSLETGLFYLQRAASGKGHLPCNDILIVSDNYDTKGVLTLLEEAGERIADVPAGGGEVDTIWMPYTGHTAKEMVPLIRHIYREVNGDLREFTIYITSSDDPRLYRMSHMAIEVLYHFAKELQ